MNRLLIFLLMLLGCVTVRAQSPSYSRFQTTNGFIVIQTPGPNYGMIVVDPAYIQKVGGTNPINFSVNGSVSGSGTTNVTLSFTANGSNYVLSMIQQFGINPTNGVTASTVTNIVNSLIPTNSGSGIPITNGTGIGTTLISARFYPTNIYPFGPVTMIKQSNHGSGEEAILFVTGDGSPVFSNRYSHTWSVIGDNISISSQQYQIVSTATNGTAVWAISLGPVIFLTNVSAIYYPVAARLDDINGNNTACISSSGGYTFTDFDPDGGPAWTEGIVHVMGKTNTSVTRLTRRTSGPAISQGVKLATCVGFGGFDIFDIDMSAHYQSLEVLSNNWLSLWDGTITNLVNGTLTFGAPTMHFNSVTNLHNNGITFYEDDYFDANDAVLYDAGATAIRYYNGSFAGGGYIWYTGGVDGFDRASQKARMQLLHNRLEIFTNCIVDGLFGVKGPANFTNSVFAIGPITNNGIYYGDGSGLINVTATATNVPLSQIQTNSGNIGDIATLRGTNFGISNFVSGEFALRAAGSGGLVASAFHGLGYTPRDVKWVYVVRTNNIASGQLIGDEGNVDDIFASSTEFHEWTRQTSITNVAISMTDDTGGLSTIRTSDGVHVAIDPNAIRLKVYAR